MEQWSGEQQVNNHGKVSLQHEDNGAGVEKAPDEIAGSNIWRIVFIICNIFD